MTLPEQLQPFNRPPPPPPPPRGGSGKSDTPIRIEISGPRLPSAAPAADRIDLRTVTGLITVEARALEIVDEQGVPRSVTVLCLVPPQPTGRDGLPH